MENKEQKSKSVSVRQRGKGDTGKMKLDKFIERVSEEIEKKILLNRFFPPFFYNTNLFGH